ncbi:hypothetical protein AOLI_G00048700 [Acnodon oligacanthus]
MELVFRDQWIGDLPRVYPAFHPMTAGIGSSSPCDPEGQAAYSTRVWQQHHPPAHCVKFLQACLSLILWVQCVCSAVVTLAA